MKIELFARVRSKLIMHLLKEAVTELTRKERVWIHSKNSDMNHIDRIGFLVGVVVDCTFLNN